MVRSSTSSVAPARQARAVRRRTISRRDRVHDPGLVGHIDSHVAKHAIPLTYGQGTPDWFVLRMFSVTSTGAATLLAQRNPLSTVKQKRDMLKRLFGIWRLNRICNTSAKPDKVAQFEIGSSNEVPVLRALPGFMRTMRYAAINEVPTTARDVVREGRALHSPPPVLELRGDPPLYRHRDPYSFVATSIDGLALLGAHDDTLPATVGVEIKTLKGVALRGAAGRGKRRLLLEALSTVTAGLCEQHDLRVILCGLDTEVAELLIPEKNHRTQVLHHAATLGLNEVLFVRADTTEILYVLILVVGAQRRRRHLRRLKEVWNLLDLGWVREERGVEYMELRPTDMKRSFVDEATLRFQYGYWLSLVMNAAEHGPLPRVDRIWPAFVRLHNLRKRGVDLFSRDKKQVMPDLRAYPPVTRLSINHIAGQMRNACIVYNMMQSYRRIREARTMKAIKRALRKMPFRTFMRHAMSYWEESIRIRAPDGLHALRVHQAPNIAAVAAVAVGGQAPAAVHNGNDHNNGGIATVAATVEQQQKVRQLMAARHNKRSAFWGTPAGIELRTYANFTPATADGVPNHTSVQVKRTDGRGSKTGRCVVCNPSASTKEGRFTKHACARCGAWLCRVANNRHFTDEPNLSCWDWFHSHAELLPRSGRPVAWTAGIVHKRRATASSAAAAAAAVPAVPVGGAHAVVLAGVAGDESQENG